MPQALPNPAVQAPTVAHDEAAAESDFRRPYLRSLPEPPRWHRPRSTRSTFSVDRVNGITPCELAPLTILDPTEELLEAWRPRLLGQQTEEIRLQGLAGPHGPTAQLRMYVGRDFLDLHARHLRSLAPLWRHSPPRGGLQQRGTDSDSHPSSGYLDDVVLPRQERCRGCSTKRISGSAGARRSSRRRRRRVQGAGEGPRISRRSPG